MYVLLSCEKEDKFTVKLSFDKYVVKLTLVYHSIIK